MHTTKILLQTGRHGAASAIVNYFSFSSADITLLIMLQETSFLIHLTIFDIAFTLLMITALIMLLKQFIFRTTKIAVCLNGSISININKQISEAPVFNRQAKAKFPQLNYTNYIDAALAVWSLGKSVS